MWWTVPSPEKQGTSEFRIRVPGFVKISQNNYQFAKMGEPVELRRDQMLAIPGSYPQYCYYITAGQVVAGATENSEHKRILLSFEENTLLLEQYLLTGKPSELYFKAVKPTKAQRISYHDLTQAMRLDFAITLDVINAISELGSLAYQRQRSESEDSARQKVCNQLLDFSLMYGTELDGRIHIGEKITHEKIGALTGLHRITVTKEIKKLKEIGILIPEDGFYIIASLDALLNYRDAP